MKVRGFDVGVCIDTNNFDNLNTTRLLVKTIFIEDQEVGMFVITDCLFKTLYSHDHTNFIIDTIAFWWEHYFIDMLSCADQLQKILQSLDSTIQLINYQLNINKTNILGSLSLLIIIGEFYIMRHIGCNKIYCIHKSIKELSRPQVSTNSSFLYDSLGTKLILGSNPKINVFKDFSKFDINTIFVICSKGFYEKINYPDILKVMFNKRIFTMQDKATQLKNLMYDNDINKDIAILVIKQFLTT